MIISLVGQKGGSGKTTTAICIASEWLVRGFRVLLVDADPQGSTKTWGDVAAEFKNQTPTIVSMGANLHRPEQLPALASSFDLVVVDCPPRHGQIQRAALMVSDLAIIPCGPSAVDAWALGETIDLVQEAKTIRPELRVQILITRRSNTAIGSGARGALSAGGLPIMKTELGFRVAYQEAPATGQGVTQYAPGSAAASEVIHLVDELEAVLGIQLEEEVSHAVA